MTPLRASTNFERFIRIKSMCKSSNRKAAKATMWYNIATGAVNKVHRRKTGFVKWNKERRRQWRKSMKAVITYANIPSPHPLERIDNTHNPFNKPRHE